MERKKVIAEFMGKTQAPKGVKFETTKTGKRKSVTFDLKLHGEALEDYLDYLEAEKALKEAEGDPGMPAREFFDKLYKERGIKKEDGEK